MRYLILTIFLIASMFTSSMANAEEYVSVQDKPEVIKRVGDLTNCKLIYFNLGLYLSMTKEINSMMSIDDSDSSIELTLENIDKNYREILEQLRLMKNEFYEKNYNPYELEYVEKFATENTLKGISWRLSQVSEKPHMIKEFLIEMIETTDLCDQKFLSKK